MGCIQTAHNPEGFREGGPPTTLCMGTEAFHQSKGGCKTGAHLVQTEALTLGLGRCSCGGQHGAGSAERLRQGSSVVHGGCWRCWEGEVRQSSK